MPIAETLPSFQSNSGVITSCALATEKEKSNKKKSKRFIKKLLLVLPNKNLFF